MSSSFSVNPRVEKIGDCKVNEVRINNCPEAVSGEPCKIKRGRSAEIEFDFTPDCDETAHAAMFLVNVASRCRIAMRLAVSTPCCSLHDFDSPTLEGRLFWASEIDIPLVGMETDSCKFTSCPIVKNEKRTYNFTLPISRKFPAGTYDVKWRITGTKPEQEECCFLTQIKLTK
ncbi:MD-2-related lipid-recognition protein-like [Hermetia illucens]|uniref:MD-2-related lipid-recognition protein-like n=1 Tax=Hermetia illucens TaxID=343691 RepID=UPI0018CBFBE9|nr:MD-2-related lipid-recognition protein-like [Hermetia illucens]